ncbi:MAG: hypothetical protein JST67_08260 [Bacteroidetes bacterium]|nr:hypothetical protein [Bacteroidota bacterium]
MSKRAFFWLCLLYTCLPLCAQRGTPDMNRKKSFFFRENDSLLSRIDSIKDILPSLELSMDGANKAIFWGRTFGLNQYTLIPSIVLSSGKGFYLYNTNYYWSKDATPNAIAKSDIGVGYDKQWNDIFSTGVSYERWIYYNGSSFVKKAIQNSLEARAAAELEWFNVELSEFYMFGTVNIFETDLELSQEFYIGTLFKKIRTYIIPEMTLIGANSNFLPIYNTAPIVPQNNNKFRLIDYELYLPIKASFANCDVSAGVYYNIPFNQTGESLKPFFYYGFSVSYTFYRDKKDLLKKAKKALSTY